MKYFCGAAALLAAALIAIGALTGALETNTPTSSSSSGSDDSSMKTLKIE